MKPTLCLGGCGKYITEESAIKLNIGKLICIECYLSYSSYKEFRFFREPLKPTKPTYNDKDKGKDLIKRILRHQLIAHSSITLFAAMIWYAIAPKSIIWFLIIPILIFIYVMLLSIRDWRGDWNNRYKQYVERLNEYETNAENLLIESCIIT